jgi:hypothetical protein
MPGMIDQSFVKQFESEVHVAYQRFGSKLRNTVRTVNGVQGESTTFQKVGYGSASQKTRHGVIPPMNLDHTPVECTLADWYAGDFVDKLDELKTKNAEREIIARNAAAALGRKTDTMIIAALDGATTYYDAANLSALTPTAGGAYFTDLLTTMGARDVPVDDGQLFGVVSWQVWNKMLLIEEFKNSDYVSADDLPFKTNATGARRWLDAIWMPHSGLTLASNVRYNFLYHKTAIGHAIGADVMTDITWEGTRAAHWVNSMMSQGAVLVDTIGVQQFRVTENA